MVLKDKHVKYIKIRCFMPKCEHVIQIYIRKKQSYSRMETIHDMVMYRVADLIFHACNVVLREACINFFTCV